jgi:hypothetical protein
MSLPKQVPTEVGQVVVPKLGSEMEGWEMVESS